MLPPLKIRRAPSGNVVIEAPPEAASTLGARSKEWRLCSNPVPETTVDPLSSTCTSNSAGFFVRGRTFFRRAEPEQRVANPAARGMLKALPAPDGSH